MRPFGRRDTAHPHGGAIAFRAERPVRKSNAIRYNAGKGSVPVIKPRPQLPLRAGGEQRPRRPAIGDGTLQHIERWHMQ